MLVRFSHCFILALGWCGVTFTLESELLEQIPDVSTWVGKVDRQSNFEIWVRKAENEINFETWFNNKIVCIFRLNAKWS